MVKSGTNLPLSAWTFPRLLEDSVLDS